MDQHEYFITPFSGTIRAGKDGPEAASRQLMETIRHYEGHGWEFDRLGTVHSLVQPGCLAALFGAQVSSVVIDLVIFRRPRQRSEATATNTTEPPPALQGQA